MEKAEGEIQHTMDCINSMKLLNVCAMLKTLVTDIDLLNLH